jgi:hypothetical protein
METKAMKEIAIYAEALWLMEENPQHPFGFQYKDWSIEVHPHLTITGERPAAKLNIFKVTHTGQLMEICHARLT